MTPQPNPIQFSKLRILPPQSPVEVALADLSNAIGDLDFAVTRAESIPELYALWRNLAEMEKRLMKAVTAAQTKLVDTELAANAGLL